MKIGIIDYGAGNLFSLLSSLSSLQIDAFVASDPTELEKADKLILPGVGAFGKAVERLKSSGLDRFVQSEVKKGTPLLGICLGMQLLYEKSYEYGEHEGLGLIQGDVKQLSDLPNQLKIPHMGWNRLCFAKKSPLYRYVKDGDHVYFVHSYYAEPNAYTSATADYGIAVTASCEKDNVFGTQYHPEKSGDTGLAILRGFAQL